MMLSVNVLNIFSPPAVFVNAVGRKTFNCQQIKVKAQGDQGECVIPAELATRRILLLFAAIYEQIHAAPSFCPRLRQVKGDETSQARIHLARKNTVKTPTHDLTRRKRPAPLLPPDQSNQHSCCLPTRSIHEHTTCQSSTVFTRITGLDPKRAIRDE